MPYIRQMLSGLTLISVALTVILSAFVRLVQTMQLRQRVMAGQTSVRELSELSGITDARDIQDIFGPPGMNRIWNHVTLATIEDKKRLAGYLMADSRLHWACIAIGILAFLIGHWTVELLLIGAALSQAGAWISAFQLPK